VLRTIWKGPLPPEQRNFAQLKEDLLLVITEVRRRAPKAQIVIATYPLILPPSGTCPKLGLTNEDAETMRTVGEHLAKITRGAALEGGAILVDMQHLGADHHACSAEPWVNGSTETVGAEFHPTLAGALATARAISDALDHATQVRTP